MSGPCLVAKTRLSAVNETQSSMVTGLLTGHNILLRHFYLVGLTDSLCRRCEVEEETSLAFCVSVKPLPLLDTINFVSYLLDPDDARNLSLGQSGTLFKGQESHDVESNLRIRKIQLKTWFLLDRSALEPILHSFTHSFMHFQKILH